MLNDRLRSRATAHRSVPGGRAKPRKSSSAPIGFFPARCSSTRRTAPSPHATVNSSSSTSPGRPSPVGQGRAQHLDALALALQLRLEPGAGKGRQPADKVVHLARGFAEIDARLGLVDFCRIGDARSGLRRAIERAALQRAQRPHHQARAALRPRRRAARLPSCRAESRRARRGTPARCRAPRSMRMTVAAVSVSPAMIAR